MRCNALRRATQAAKAQLRNLSIDTPSALPLAVTKFSPDGTSTHSTKNEPVTCVGDQGPWVFVHGLFGSRANFRTMSKQFAATTQRDVLTVDLRNHGDSPWHNTLDYPALANDLGACLAEHVQTTTPATVIGHSMGGKAVMTLALQEPSLINKLVVVDIAPLTYPTMRQARAVARAMASVPLTGPNAITTRQAADEYLRRDVQEDVIRRFALTNFVQNTKGDGAARWRVNLDVILTNMKALSAFPTDLSGLSYDQPSLFVYGKKSDYVIESSHDVIQRFFPQSKLEGAETGHWVHAEQPKWFMDHVIRFAGQNKVSS
eukprot:TRINITY_DN20880_c0_g1_i1.p1 TRINITY_DN20880_c0_g1~~TRINITY_DN20880_c0_g1_i1.p1  ORF type:complete len:317 (+),score=72.34 TRINITY_DN20880_c0_g1_i1:31-981(+)